MKIGIAFSLHPAHTEAHAGPDDRFEEFDKPETVEALAQVFRNLGHEVALLGDGRGFLERTLAGPPDFVFNIAEGDGVGRCREARVPAVLEILGIPYSGSDPLTLAATLDKSVARTLVRPAGVPLPDGIVIPPGSEIEVIETAYASLLPDGDMRPLIVKPLAEGSSKGVRESKSLVENRHEFLQAVRRIHDDYFQPALVEEFIDGDEITVGLIGSTTDPSILGIMRIVPQVAEARFVYSIEVKRDWRRRVVYEVPARLSIEDRAEVVSVAMRAYRALGCRDLARIDIRLRDGVAYFIEANPLPGLNPESSDLAILARGVEVPYERLIERILNIALARNGLVGEPRLPHP